MTTGQVMDIVADRLWWLRIQNGTGEQEPREYAAEEAEELQQRLRARAERIGWL